MIEAIIISLLVFAANVAALIVGYRIGYKEASDKYSPELNGGKIYRAVTAGEHISKDSLVRLEEIPNEPAGIIHRPSSEELAKMNEEESVKQAKQAMAETFSQEKEPEL